ncbi:gp52 [Escherichia phage phiEB49]|uniref:Gp52 n=1 Tax=Escherichia phage phiEB49 TaxID=1048207 RepID=F8UBW2_9CAUD|nr:major head protein [Escherichia phage phiEB49]AEI91252.1 gp52 [Escherichia phage phiEB49]
MAIKFDAEQAKITAHLEQMGVDKADAAGIWTVSQLTAALNRAYEKEYAENSVVNIFPVTNEIPGHAKYFEYPEFDGVGIAQIIADYSDDLPLVDAFMTEKQGKVFRFGNAFLISTDEIKAGAATGQSLSTRKQALAFEAHDNLLDKLVWSGSAPHGIPSVFDHPNINNVVAGTWNSAAAAMTDITALIDAIETSTNGTHTATDILLPASARRLMQELVPNTSISYAQLFATNNSGINLRYLQFLDNYDGAGGKAALAFEKNPLNASIEIPEATNVLPGQVKDLHIKYPVTSKSTGLVIYRPLTFAVMKGITFA